MLHIRKASKSDINIYFKWANDPEVRNNAFNQQPITYEKHKIWFSEKINNDKCYLYVICDDGNPLAQVRFDIEEQCAVISYSLDHKYRGHGYGRKVLQLAINTFFDEQTSTRQLKALVKCNNIASNKIFQNLGFHMVDNQNNQNIVYYTSINIDV